MLGFQGSASGVHGEGRVKKPCLSYTQRSKCGLNQGQRETRFYISFPRVSYSNRHRNLQTSQPNTMKMIREGYTAVWDST